MHSLRTRHVLGPVYQILLNHLHSIHGYHSPSVLIVGAGLASLPEGKIQHVLVSVSIMREKTVIQLRGDRYEALGRIHIELEASDILPPLLSLKVWRIFSFGSLRRALWVIFVAYDRDLCGRCL